MLLNKLKNLSITIKILLITAMLFLFVILYCLSEMFAVFKPKCEVTLTIQSGSGVKQIAKQLKENDLIDSELIFYISTYADRNKFKAGVHTFNSKNHFDIKKELLMSPKEESVTVTIPEGYEQREIALLLESKGLCTAEEFNNTAKLSNFGDFWFLKNIPVREYQLDGYLFPDTYEFSYSEGVKSIINKMLVNFENKISLEMKKRAEKLGKSFDEIIIMASIVEREVASEDELNTVAGVFYNRLKFNNETAGFLSSCATVQYVLNERKDVLDIKDTKIDSPYNTYMYQGLPIGPIASPGLKAIEASLYPEDTDYLYFVADGNGKHYFSKTLSEHESNKRKAGL